MAQLIKDQKEISSCAVDIIRGIKNKTGKSLEPRDRMALQLLTPKNSALVLNNGNRNLGCRQVTFDILTDDIGKGSHRLVPTGIHVKQKQNGWWSDNYGVGQFLWNLQLKEEPKEGVVRILERLFRFKMKGVFGSKADIRLKKNQRTIAANIDERLKLLIQREGGSVETTLRRMIKADALYLPDQIGLTLKDKSRGHLVLLFGKSKRFGVSFSVEKLK